ncbi:MAG: hypothetical protein V3G42_08540 [Oscillospiraceae bacterium]
MKPSGIQRIAVAVPQAEQFQLFFASITEMMVNGYVTHHQRNFNISMRERGKEILNGADDIAEGMKASDKARAFSFLSLNTIPDEMELVLRENKQYCGTAHFYGVLPSSPIQKYQDMIDTIVIIIDEKATPFTENWIQNTDAGVCMIVVNNSPEQAKESAEEYLKNQANSLYALAVERMHSFHWYHPYGFQSDGTRKPLGDATPYGVEEIFWSIMRISATMRMNYLQKLAEEQGRMIQRRSGIFQKNSLRRRMELNQARGIYSMAVQGMYAVEQLLASAEGKPLAEDT